MMYWPTSLKKMHRNCNVHDIATGSLYVAVELYFCSPFKLGRQNYFEDQKKMAEEN